MRKDIEIRKFEFVTVMRNDSLSKGWFSEVLTVKKEWSLYILYVNIHFSSFFMTLRES